MFSRIVILICCIFCTLAVKQSNNYLSDEYIASLNAKQSSWVAGRNFDDVPRMYSVIKKLVSSDPPSEELPPFNDKYYITGDTADIPESFDARQEWPNCKTIIGRVWDQGVCSTGWAMSAASVLSDRICIHSNQTKNPVLAPEDLLSCCTKCRFGCNSGWPNFAWEYFNSSGITTGGPYLSNEGCKPYSNPPCGHYNESSQMPCSEADPACASPCYKACQGDSQIVYKDNLYYAQEYYRVSPEESQIKLDIMQNGPVQATFAVWTDFLNYKTGVYVEKLTSSYLGDQSVKIIGWGTENGQAYWSAVNSWNSEWGDAGRFKWLINNTDSAMESQIYAALPIL